MSTAPAIDPTRNATVSASAGSGKTWLLVTRILRLLLAGNAPGNILALTFTRKAATEMSMRLSDRLFEMATVDDDRLDALLRQAGAAADEPTRRRARELYEELLFADYPVRLSTFHSFCRDILSRFALEADVPPGFVLQEDTSLLRQQAWEQLLNEATRYPDGVISRELDVFMAACNGPANTRTALFNMLEHRSDWWAWTEHQDDAVAFADDELAQQLDIDPGSDSHIESFFTRHADALHEFHGLLGKHANKTNLKAQSVIAQALEELPYTETTLQQLGAAFLTKTGTPLAQGRTLSATLQKKMGDAGADRFIALHLAISEALLACNDVCKRQHAWRINSSWFRLGDNLVHNYQQLKRERRVLDFADLEWHCYRLLSDGDNALWVQYKLDQSIDHILIDEFQDTNPTQWQLLKPLLDEMAASWSETESAERARSIFLVGDEKQSIYSFRRANPALQQRVSDWLGEKLGASATPLTWSWRSSPAIMHYVNAVFRQDEISKLVPAFDEHDTHHAELPGRVTLLPEFDADEQHDTNPEFRNPLQQPRVMVHDNARDKEAACIAEQIAQLMQQGRIRDYSEVMVLIRNRTHLAQYEEVFRQHGLPFLSDRKGGLLDNLEIQDMERLLDVLITPFDNLALAQVLKSPLFGASDDELKTLAHAGGRALWYQRLLRLAETLPADATLTRAAERLQHWRAQADILPVHDLLEMVFAEGHVIARYCASAPHRARQVTANLQRFIDLALDVESGRYPSLGQFKHYLRNMREHASDQLGMPDDGDEQRRVRIMTIHASKGLEAPVVFLADSNSSGNDRNAWNALVEWPEHAPRPTSFQLQFGQADTDSTTRQVIERRSQAQQREDLNLLYVALTRARQYLFVSAVAGKQGWYPLLSQAMDALAHHKDDDGDGDIRHYRFGDAGSTAAEHAESANEVPRLQRDIEMRDHAVAGHPQRPVLIAPSLVEGATEYRQGDDAEDADAALRGRVIHRLLELMSEPAAIHKQAALQRVAAEFDTHSGDVMLQDCADEAAAVLAHADLEDLFDSGRYRQVFKEMPMLYRDEQVESDGVFGLVDRLLVDDQQVTVVDYKSHRIAHEQAGAVAAGFRRQLDYYRRGARLLWPEKKVRCCAVFTHTQQRIWLDD